MNTKIYTDISLPNHYEIETKYDVYITWSSSNVDVINPTSGQVNRTLKDQSCTLTANILYKSLTDNINFYLTIPANVYSDSSNGFPQKNAVEIKVSYMELGDNLKIKIKVANNSKQSDNIYGIKSMTFSIYYQGYHYLVKNLKYTNENTKQFTLEPGKCIEIVLPVISKNFLLTNYLIDTSYYCKISSLSYYNLIENITHVLYKQKYLI